jgi:division protein CdvB (Snf7/Vps24/ESCRT-III family)
MAEDKSDYTKVEKAIQEDEDIIAYKNKVEKMFGYPMEQDTLLYETFYDIMDIALNKPTKD